MATIFARPAVQRFFATLLAAFTRGDRAQVDAMYNNLEIPVNERVYGDAIPVLRIYIEIRRGTHATVRLSAVELHTAFGFNPP